MSKNTLQPLQKIKAIIVDDELAARNILNSLIGLAFPNIEIVATAENLTDAVVLIKEKGPQLVFLDVEMPNYAGYEIVRFFDKIDFHIIFVTAYNQYAINAFEINAIDYLLKPIERSRLQKSIDKVIRKIEDNTISANYQSLVTELETSKTKTIVLSESGSRHILNVNKILAISANGAYSEVHLDYNKKMLVSKNIGTLEQELKNVGCFVRTHKSWIVNKEHIVEYQKGKQLVILSNNIVAKVSRFKKEEFEEKIK